MDIASWSQWINNRQQKLFTIYITTELIFLVFKKYVKLGKMKKQPNGNVGKIYIRKFIKG